MPARKIEIRIVLECGETRVESAPLVMCYTDEAPEEAKRTLGDNIEVSIATALVGMLKLELQPSTIVDLYRRLMQQREVGIARNDAATVRELLRAAGIEHTLWYEPAPVVQHAHHNETFKVPLDPNVYPSVTTIFAAGVEFRFENLLLKGIRAKEAL